MTHAPKITGATRLYAIIGDPIAQVRSPETFTERFAAAGLDAVLFPLHVPADRFDTIVPALVKIGNLDGLLVTVPFKARMVAFANQLGTTARTVGAVNALRREDDGSWTGDMFDGTGFVRGVEAKGDSVCGRRVALFGAGGAGSAIACALADAGVKSISIVDPDAPKARALIKRLTRSFPDRTFETAESMPRGVDMVVNASPVGMKAGDGLPAEIGPLDPGTLVGDVVITPTPTAIVRHAMQFGCRWIDGRDMHAGQADAITAFFTDVSRAARIEHGAAH
jgi:shikimate dehydrogenase